MKYSSRVIPISYSSVTIKFLYSNSLPYRLLLSAQTTPFRYSFQLFLSATPSYSYQLLGTGSRYWPFLCEQLVTVSATLINQSFQLFRYCYQVTLSHTPISYSHQSFASNLLAYSYNVLQAELLCKWSLSVTVSHTPNVPFAKVLQNRCP